MGNNLQNCHLVLYSGSDLNCGLLTVHTRKGSGKTLPEFGSNPRALINFNDASKLLGSRLKISSTCNFGQSQLPSANGLAKEDNVEASPGRRSLITSLSKAVICVRTEGLLVISTSRSKTCRRLKSRLAIVRSQISSPSSVVVQTLPVISLS